MTKNATRNPQYDYLIVGAGMFGATFARLATDDGKRCLVIDKRSHIGGNCYTEAVDGINVHMYGPHIFHCNDENIWRFVNRFAQFNSFKNSPIAMFGGKAYSLPFSLYTFNQLWGVTTPQEAIEKLESQRLQLNRAPDNLEEQALCLVGRDIYETLIKGYTIKQWKRHPRDLPASIIKRLPVRLTWNNDYFDDKYQGIPIGGYTAMFEKMLHGIEVQTSIDYFENKISLDDLAHKTLFTGKIDEFYRYRFGELEYRTLKFEGELIDIDNFQGNAVINYTDEKIPWTRIIEHKHFEPKYTSPNTYITREIPDEWSASKVPYYPIADKRNLDLWKKYDDFSQMETRIIFGGRLTEYRYYDMHQVIASAMVKYRRLSEQ